MLVKFSLVVVLKVIYQNMPLYLASAFPFSLQGCPTSAGGRPLIYDSSDRSPEFARSNAQQVYKYACATLIDRLGWVVSDTARFSS